MKEIIPFVRTIDMKTETNYIHEVLAGDLQAYQYLVERYQTGLIIYCERMVGNREEAEDIAQEAFIKAYERLGDFKAEKARFSTWLYRIAANKAIDHLRRTKRKVDIENLEEMADSASEPDLKMDEIEEIHLAVDSLEPPEITTVIKAYYWHGKSYKTIAAELNIPINTVGTWMHRGKLQLKEKLS